MSAAVEIPVSVFDYGYGESIKIHRFHEWAQLAQFELVKEAYDAATSDASDPDGLGWVYLKHRSVVFETKARPRRVKVRTWLSDLSGNRTMREYTIHDETDEFLLFQRSTTSVALDLATLKPTTRDLSHLRRLIGAESQGLPVRAAEFPATSTSFAMTRSVQPDDIDFNRHVNNTTYIRWIYDAVLRRTFEQEQALAAPRLVRDFQIQYLRPIALGGRVTLQCVTNSVSANECDWKVEIAAEGAERPGAIALATVVS